MEEFCYGQGKERLALYLNGFFVASLLVGISDYQPPIQHRLAELFLTLQLAIGLQDVRSVRLELNDHPIVVLLKNWVAYL